MSKLVISDLLRNQSKFLLMYGARNNFESENFIKSGITWDDLIDIANDYIGKYDLLLRLQSDFLSRIQEFDNIHSIKTRIKDTEHLIEKVIRKIARDGIAINKLNYFDLITDIIGIRIIHLSRFESCALYKQICSEFKSLFNEKVSIKLRDGDSEELYNELISNGAIIERGERYRSIHYTLKTDEKFCIEIQTRTIFEEGWSEIDHDSTYKSTHKNDLMKFYSTVLSRLTGVCDDLAIIMRNKPFKNEDFTNNSKDLEQIEEEFVKYILK